MGRVVGERGAGEVGGREGGKGDRERWEGGRVREEVQQREEKRNGRGGGIQSHQWSEG